MRKIKLTKGQTALVDDEDYDYLNQFKWCAIPKKYTFYVARRIGKTNKYMHRIIMKTPKGMEVDHIDFNGLNCQKANMRNCYCWQNKVHKKATGKSKYLGVHLPKNRKSFVATIRVNGEIKYLGSSRIEELAALMYDNAARIYHGEFANLNFK